MDFGALEENANRKMISLKDASTTTSRRRLLHSQRDLDDILREAGEANDTISRVKSGSELMMNAMRLIRAQMMLEKRLGLIRNQIERINDLIIQVESNMDQWVSGYQVWQSYVNQLDNLEMQAWNKEEMKDDVLSALDTIQSKLSRIHMLLALMKSVDPDFEPTLHQIHDIKPDIDHRRRLQWRTEETTDVMYCDNIQEERYLTRDECEEQRLIEEKQKMNEDHHQSDQSEMQSETNIIDGNNNHQIGVLGTAGSGSTSLSVGSSMVFDFISGIPDVLKVLLCPIVWGVKLAVIVMIETVNAFISAIIAIGNAVIAAINAVINAIVALLNALFKLYVLAVKANISSLVNTESMVSFALKVKVVGVKFGFCIDVSLNDLKSVVKGAADKSAQVHSKQEQQALDEENAQGMDSKGRTTHQSQSPFMKDNQAPIPIQNEKGTKKSDPLKAEEIPDRKGQPIGGLDLHRPLCEQVRI